MMQAFRKKLKEVDSEVELMKVGKQMGKTFLISNSQDAGLIFNCLKKQMYDI